MKIVLGGYIVGYPLGGMTWHHLNYVCGLLALGHDVTFFEDGAFLPPFDPIANAYGDPTYGVEYFRQTLESMYGYWLVDAFPWHYRYGTFSAGLSIDEMRRRLREADLFIAVSGVTPLDWYDLPKRTLVIDTDPVFTQLKMTDNAALRGYYARFMHQATFGRLIGTPASPLPTHGFDWIPTNQPIVLDCWPATRPSADGLLTTVGKWEHDATRTVAFNGRRYASSKGVEYDRVIDLPERAGTPIEMRMAGLVGDEARRFQDHGWHLGDPLLATRDPDSFRRYVQHSLGEFTVAKAIYAGVPSGWFSDRSACFLASGRPVITQSSGFEAWLPTGEGLLGFSTPDEAAAAVRTVNADRAKHGRAARAIAAEFFDARNVLSDLLARVV